MATNLAAQLDALVELSVDYWGARDLTWGVLSRAFGDPLPPLSQCVWPPSGITEQEANSRLRSVRDFLQQWGSGHIRGVIREIRKAQEGLVASGFDPPDSWIIANPLEDLMGGAMGLCGVREIVRSVPAEHAALEKVRGEVEVALIRLRGKIAGRQVGAKSEQGEAATATGSTAPADQTKRGEGTSGADSTPVQPEPLSGDAREAAFRKLEPAVRKAYLAFQYVESKAERGLEDRDAYDWLNEDGIDQDKGDLGELAGYAVPDSLETFRRYLGIARKALGENKYTRRGGRKRGSSVVRGDEIEYQQGDDS